jgi:hypothetical protein
MLTFKLTSFEGRQGIAASIIESSGSKLWAKPANTHTATTNDAYELSVVTSCFRQSWSTCINIKIPLCSYNILHKAAVLEKINERTNPSNLRPLSELFNSLG